MRSIVLGICSLFVTNCVTLDKLRTEDCRDVINNSPVISMGYTPEVTDSGMVAMCSSSGNVKCCLLFSFFSDDNIVGADGMCYLGDSKYQYKTTCMEERP